MVQGKKQKTPSGFQQKGSFQGKKKERVSVHQELYILLKFIPNTSIALLN